MNMSVPKAQTASNPSTKGRVVLLNDKAIYNTRYRAPLLARLSDEGFGVDSKGVLDSFSGLFAILSKLRSRTKTLTISSNLKSNLFALVFARGPLIVIVNGLGRFRASPTLRSVLRYLMRRKPTCQFIVQSYADYRYFRRHTGLGSLHWLPGSGGRCKLVGKGANCVLVQRDGKIDRVAHSVREYMETAGGGRTLIVVGCEDTDRLKTLFAGLDFHSTGYLHADEILSGGTTFLQPAGYGEGFPHTLADAIASGVDIVIANKEYLRYGLHRLGATREPVSAGWSRLGYGEALQQATGAETIARKTLELCGQATGNS